MKQKIKFTGYVLIDTKKLGKYMPLDAVVADAISQTCVGLYDSRDSYSNPHGIVTSLALTVKTKG